MGDRDEHGSAERELGERCDRPEVDGRARREREGLGDPRDERRGERDRAQGDARAVE
jgi:hypothetical protein